MLQRKTIISISIIVLLLLLAMAWRFFTLEGSGRGQAKDSPDEKFTASIMVNKYDRFFGGHNYDYKLEIYQIIPIDKNLHRRKTLKTLKTYPLPGEELLSAAGKPDIINWAEDSMSATFTFQGVELKLNIDESADNK